MASAATAKPLSPSSNRLVVRVVYRALCRLAALHDSRPALKALLEQPMYSDSSLTRQFPRCALAIERFYGRNVRFYVEPKPLRAFIRSEFKRHHQAPPDTTSSLLADAFYVLRLLKDNAARRNKDDRLFVSEAVLAVDPAAPSSISALLPSGWNVQPVLPIEDIPSHTPSPPSPSASSLTSSPIPAPPSSDTSPTPSLSLSPRKRGRPRLQKKSLISHYDDVRLEPGLLLVAHPAWQFDPFTQSVILVTKHDEEGESEGVIINKPMGGLIKLDDTDAIEQSVLQLYKRFLTQLQRAATAGAGWSGAEKVGGGGGTGGGGGGGQVAGPPLLFGGPVNGLSCLHRLSAFADVSREVVGGEWPVYLGQLPFWEALHRTVTQLEQGGGGGGGRGGGGEAKVVGEGAGGASTDAATAVADVQLFMGTCKWQPGQLRAELRTGIWLLCKGNGLHVFTQPKQAKLSSAYPAPSSPQPFSPSSAIPLPPSNPPSPPSSSRSSPSSPASTLFASHVPALTFPWQHLWAHCVWQLGGEWRSMAQVEEVKGGGGRGLEGWGGEVKGKERGAGQRGMRKKEEAERWDDTGSTIP